MYAKPFRGRAFGYYGRRRICYLSVSIIIIAFAIRLKVSPADQRGRGHHVDPLGLMLPGTGRAPEVLVAAIGAALLMLSAP